MGLVSAASLSLALMVVAPASAVVGGTPEVGDPCATTDAPIDGFVCTDGALARAADPTPSPVETTPAPTEAPAVDPAPVVPPADPPPASDAPAGPVVVTPADPAAPAPAPAPAPADPAAPAAPPAAGAPAAGSPSTPGGAPTPVTVVTAPGTSLRDSVSGIDPAGASTSLLAAATVSNLAATDLPTLAAMRSLPVFPGQAGLPLSAYVPSPDLAGIPLATLPPSTRIAAVQEPLLAAGEDAAGAGGFTLASLGGRALPGLLVVLATALVASIGAANIRVWADRMGIARS